MKKVIINKYLYLGRFNHDDKYNKAISKLNELIEQFNNWQLNSMPKDMQLDKLIAELPYVNRSIYESNLSDKDKWKMFTITDEIFKFIESKLPNNKKDREHWYIAPLEYKFGDDTVILTVNMFIDKFNKWQLNLKPKDDEFQRLIQYFHYTTVMIINSKLKHDIKIQAVINDGMIFLNKYLPKNKYLQYPENW